jgi:hypothetical protein
LAAYVPGNSITLNLRGVPGDVDARWVNTWTGDDLPGEAKSAALTVRKPAAFGEAPAVIILKGVQRK